jgi:hypothetical protein
MHGAHHEAQTLRIHTLPSISFCEKVFSGCASSGNSKAGAGLPISGEGTSRGLSVSPTASRPTRAAKMPMTQ